jgi:S1-C subfamily serine protease
MADHHSEIPSSQTKSRSTGKRVATSLALVLMGAGAATTGAYYAWGNKANESAPTASVTTQRAYQTTPASLSLPAEASSVAEVVQAVGPAVVRIDSSRMVSSQPSSQIPEELRQFFGDRAPFGGSFESPQERTEKGVGSGFIVSEDGRIITNAHVIEGSDTVQVTLKDGRTFEGKVLGSDPVTDVAVIDLEANDLPTLSLSNAELLPGEVAIAIGNPLGLDNTVTVGIVSATGRTSGQVGIPDQRVNFIQTDAAINPGNSGGPLLNAKGEVIGMNTAIISGAQGLGFAIPITAVQRISDQIVATGKVEHPFIGIEMVTLTPELRESVNQSAGGDFRVKADSGVLIGDVLSGSPAARAGLRPGDVVKEINGEAITTGQQVQTAVEANGLSQDLRLDIDRNGKQQSISLRPEPMPAQG